MTRWILLIAGVLGILGVTLGAYAAHGLEAGMVKQGLAAEDIAKRLTQCDIAVRYHMLHALALLALALSPSVAGKRRTSLAAFFILLGIALFSGGLYSMVFLGEMGHWAIVPSGGLCFILGWFAVTTLAFSSKTGAKSVE